eukprot:CAMPEP_0183419834 /NCGR_PEP_ID=MMETSP0370-20130417/26046_1 /TAXON_ID=268820 /ORGANISM="Peridinium aciculiferum, Strain PAER-2" /LENGTH=210 /DNA_ID=CAMNT_0025603669 /DNA_START=21 /DNA_END=650 /DNA_ORIENTATION=+
MARAICEIRQRRRFSSPTSAVSTATTEPSGSTAARAEIALARDNGSVLLPTWSRESTILLDSATHSSTGGSDNLNNLPRPWCKSCWACSASTSNFARVPSPTSVNAGARAVRRSIAATWNAATTPGSPTAIRSRPRALRRLTLSTSSTICCTLDLPSTQSTPEAVVPNLLVLHIVPIARQNSASMEARRAPGSSGMAGVVGAASRSDPTN